MTEKDIEFLRNCGAIYEFVMNQRSDKDYVLNEKQMCKFIELVKFLKQKAEGCNARIEPIDFIPKEQNGDVIAEFASFNLFDEDIVTFCDLLKESKAINIEATTDGEVRFSIMIPDVFIHKNEAKL